MRHFQVPRQTAVALRWGNKKDHETRLHRSRDCGLAVALKATGCWNGPAPRSGCLGSGRQRLGVATSNTGGTAVDVIQPVLSKCG